MQEHAMFEPSLGQSGTAWMPLGWQTDSAGTLTDANRAWLGFTRVDVRSNGVDWRAAIHPDDLRTFDQHWRRGDARSRALEMRLRLRHHGGSYRWFLVRALPDPNAHGWKWSATDIHALAQQLEYERAQTEETREALLEAQQQTRQSLTENGVAVLEFDAERRLRFASREAAEVLGGLGNAFGKGWDEVMARMLDSAVVERLSRDIQPTKSGPADRALGPVASWVKIVPNRWLGGLTVLVRGRAPTLSKP
jgi:PAS domain-containing protein